MYRMTVHPRGIRYERNRTGRGGRGDGACFSDSGGSDSGSGGDFID